MLDTTGHVSVCYGVSCTVQDISRQTCVSGLQAREPRTARLHGPLPRTLRRAMKEGPGLRKHVGVDFQTVDAAEGGRCCLEDRAGGL
jgi:hypothetical protein